MDLHRTFPDRRLFLLTTDGEILRIARREGVYLFRGPNTFLIDGAPCQKRSWLRIPLRHGDDVVIRHKATSILTLQHVGITSANASSPTVRFQAVAESTWSVAMAWEAKGNRRSQGAVVGVLSMAPLPPVEATT